MSLSNMKSKDAILKAMKEFDNIGRTAFLIKYGFGKSKEYFLDFEGKLYDSKAIIGAAHGYEFPEQGPLSSNDFSGGNASVKPKLEAFGFSVRAIEAQTETELMEEEEAIEASISFERDLESFLAKDLQKLEQGLHLYRANGILGRQVDAKSAGRIDLLAEDKDNNLVVIEIKVGEVDREVCGQIQAYMSWVKNVLAGGKSVRGIVVAKDFTDRLRLAAKMVPELSLRKYRVDFEFMDA
jgi:hypothetical protein